MAGGGPAGRVAEPGSLAGKQASGIITALKRLIPDSAPRHDADGATQPWLMLRRCNAAPARAPPITCRGWAKEHERNVTQSVIWRRQPLCLHFPGRAIMRNDEDPNRGP